MVSPAFTVSLGVVRAPSLATTDDVPSAYVAVRSVAGVVEPVVSYSISMSEIVKELLGPVTSILSGKFV